jgi:RNA polymerase sigma factor (sigma-70 family)
VSDSVDDDLIHESGELGLVLWRLADHGEGVVLGLVPAGRAGIRRVSRALTEAFEARLVQAYRDRSAMLVRYAARKVSDQARAEDVVQRAFEKILRRHREDQPEIRNLEAYLLTAVCNEINRELRSVVRDRLSLVVDSTDAAAETPSPRADVSTEITDALAVSAALAALPPREREAVVLRIQWQLSVSEAADVMRLSSGAVKRYTADGLRRLRERFSAPDRSDRAEVEAG